MNMTHTKAEHAQPQQQAARFLSRAAEPHAAAWEDTGMGFIHETPIERLWRDARVLGIGSGAAEVMLEEVAKRYGTCNF